MTLLLIFTIKSFSQDSKFSLELNYPIPIDKNFVGENYDGIIDIGAKFRFVDLKLVNIGASLNGGLLVNNTNDSNGSINVKVNSYLVQPRIFAELDSEIVKIHPFIGLGYTFMVFDASGTNNGFDVSGASETQSGLNLNLGIAYDITNSVFVQVQYDYIKIKVDNGVPDMKYNTNVNILKIGIGYRL
ncbi:outer membrane beta-barrel protein [Mariniflexile soesokkakense]|uniref:Outer membrane beta-barrel protein n=1 Tax=Mariniflexile soesokkakense TaxID=1343160 RepID=A0ABV0A6X3_9FLAO